MTCDNCKEGYVKGKNGGCFIDTNIKNCVLAASTSLCDKCADEFVLVNRKCETPGITNCEEYWNNRYVSDEFFEMFSDVKQICEKCETDYYLKQNKCEKGNVKYCKHMLSEI